MMCDDACVWSTYIFFLHIWFSQNVLGKKIGGRRSSFVDFSFLSIIKPCNKPKIKFPDFSDFGKNKDMFLLILYLYMT